jgi:hypothetical protein
LTSPMGGSATEGLWADLLHSVWTTSKPNDYLLEFR